MNQGKRQSEVINLNKKTAQGRDNNSKKHIPFK